jgi:hypothetical protein
VPTPGACTAALLALFTLLSSPASAQLPRQVEIEWTGSPLCPRSAALEGEVARLLGPSAARIEPTRFSARVDELAERSTNYYRLTLRVRSQSRTAERSVELPTCGEVQDAAALLIASAIDPTATLRVAEPRPPAPPALEDPPVAELATPARPPAPWAARAQAGLDLFTLTDPTLSLGVGVVLQQPRYLVWGEARYLLARRERHPELETKLDLFAGALGSAFLWPVQSLRVGPACELELGLYRARGRARSTAIEPSRSSALWSSALLGAVVAYAVVPRVSLELALFAGLPFRRAEVRLEKEDALHKTAPLTMRLALGVRVSLGSD